MGFMFLIFGGFALFVIFASISANKKAKARIAALRLWAQSKGLNFSEFRDHNLTALHPGIRALNQGSNRYAYNISTGQWGDYTTTVFDYHYETHSTNSKGQRQTHHHHFSAVALQPSFPLKPILIRREGFFDKVKAGFGFDDIDFESAEFSKKFYVKAEDKRWAYDLLHTRTMEFLLQDPSEYIIECDHQSMFVIASKTLDIPDFQHTYTYGTHILDGIPDYARQK